MRLVSGGPTYDAALQVVPRSAQQDLLLFDGLLWRHLSFGVRAGLRRLERISGDVRSRVDEPNAKCRPSCRIEECVKCRIEGLSQRNKRMRFGCYGRLEPRSLYVKTVSSLAKYLKRDDGSRRRIDIVRALNASSNKFVNACAKLPIQQLFLSTSSPPATAGTFDILVPLVLLTREVATEEL